MTDPHDTPPDPTRDVPPTATAAGGGDEDSELDGHLALEIPLDLLEAALQLDTECALAWRYCGEMAIARGDLVEATRCLALALRILS